MDSKKQNSKVKEVKGTPVWQNPRVRRIGTSALVLLTVFLLGFVPMWMSGREKGRARDTAQTALRVSQLQNTLASAAIDARRGDYEPARQSASEFFTSLRTELERGRESAFNQTQQENLRGLLATRDDTITLLARNDPAAADRLFDLFINYRQAM